MPQLIASVEGVEIRHVYLQKDHTTLGRRPGNDIVLDNLVVSGNHCVFHLAGIADVTVEDLHSTNGTCVNGEMVKYTRKLEDGDVLAIGNFHVQYLQASEQPSGFGQTSAMQLGPVGGSHPQLHAGFKVLTGTSAGLEVPVVKAVTTFGKPGVAVIAVSHRRQGFFVAFMGGSHQPAINGEAMGPDALPLRNGDVIDLAGTRMVFILKE